MSKKLKVTFKTFETEVSTHSLRHVLGDFIKKPWSLRILC